MTRCAGRPSRKGRRTGRPCHRFFAWLALFALWLNIVGLPVSAADAPPIPLGEQVICTANGMVPLDQAQHDGETADHSGPCVFCLPLLHGGLPVADPAPSESWPPVQLVLPGERPPPEKPRRLAEPATPRAPPLS